MKAKEIMNDIITFINIVETFMMDASIDFWDDNIDLYEECVNVIHESNNEIDADVSSSKSLMDALKKIKRLHVKASGEYSHWLGMCNQ